MTIITSQQEELQDRSHLELSNQHFDEQEPVHNTYDIEKQLLQYVKTGDINKLQQWLDHAPAMRSGTMAVHHLRQLKNTFIVASTLISRAAIEGGLSTERSFTLSDSYIQKVELLNSADRIMNLQYHMVLDFTSRVHEIRMKEHPSKLFLEVSRYVHEHLSEPITVNEIAQALYMSRPYLSYKFKEENGMSLSTFIQTIKIEEAKHLLLDTNKSLTMIALYLGYSSTSHFSHIFSQYTHISPSTYRKTQKT